MSRGVLGLAALLLGLMLTAGCAGGGSGGDGSNTATTKPALPYDPGTKVAAQGALDQALMNLKGYSTAHFSTWVSKGEKEIDDIDVIGSFDLTRHLFKAVTTFPSEDINVDQSGVRSRVIGKDVFVGPDFGPYKTCWFNDSGAKLGSILGVGAPADTESAWIPQAIALATDSQALGTTVPDATKIRVMLSAKTALTGISEKFASRKAAVLPDEDVRVIGTLTFSAGELEALTVRGKDVVDALEKAGADLFKGENFTVENALRSQSMTTAFDTFGEVVTVKRPAPSMIVELNDDGQVVAGQATCVEVAS